jgi:hypothetical protein
MRLLPKGMVHNDFQLPDLKLADPTGLIDIAVSDVRMNSLHNSHGGMQQMESLEQTSSYAHAYIQPHALEKAHALFNSICVTGTHAISIYRLADVLYELGLNLGAHDITEIISQLELKDTLDLSFAEAVEIATFIHEQKASSQHYDSL